jgi:hypothetical protein
VRREGGGGWKEGKTGRGVEYTIYRFPFMRHDMRIEPVSLAVAALHKDPVVGQGIST